MCSSVLSVSTAHSFPCYSCTVLHDRSAIVTMSNITADECVAIELLRFVSFVLQGERWTRFGQRAIKLLRTVEKCSLRFVVMCVFKSLIMHSLSSALGAYLPSCLLIQYITTLNKST